MTASRWTACFLRFIAVIQMLTFGIVFVPTAWIASWHLQLGLGQMPDAAFLRYVIRGACYSQGAIGVLLLVIATDVVRYRSLVHTIGAIYLVAGPVFYFINSIAGLPRWWCLMDSIACFLTGGVILTLCRLSSSKGQRSP